MILFFSHQRTLLCLNEGLQLLTPHGWVGARSRVWHAANLPSLSSSHPAMGISALI